mgnify:CR=1 FL=1
MQRTDRTVLTVFFLTLALLLAATSGQAQTPGRAPTCDDLVWSAQVLAANPDIDESCQGVYQRGNELYAKVGITLTRVRGNRLTFRPEHLDGSQGKARSIVVPNSWRATIDGREDRARDLLALAIGESTLSADEDVELIEIEEAAVVSSMPKTASVLPSTFIAGLLLLATGLLLRTLRRRGGEQA